MPGLTIGWEYLTGYYVATAPSSRERPEWPPHPGRVFMALAAAWFETGEDVEEDRALRWLESLDDPQMFLPPRAHVFPRRIVDVYVPVNDTAAPYDWPDKKKKATVHPHLGSVAVGRLRKPRTFPCTWVGESPCFLRWPAVTDADQHRPALDQLCSKVTRIGHSSSLVRMWLADEPYSPQSEDVWVPADNLAELQVRRISSGTLALLDRQFNGRGRAEHDRLCGEIEALSIQKKAVRGRGAAVTARKVEIDRQIRELQEQLRSVDARPPIRPKLGLWTGYRREVDTTPPSVKHTEFDSDLLILTQTDGPRLPLSSTLAVTQALRGTVMSQSGVQPPPSWVSGHLEGCQPLRDGRQHLAYVPMPFVGADYADGHLLGLALAFPREIPRQDRGRVLGRLLLQPSGEAKLVRLTLGQLGVWGLVKRDWSETRRGLNPETWTAHPGGATTWATVTPVVLDRFPKADPLRERAKWNVEVAGIIATACGRLGLADPAEICFGTTSWHRGSPRASVKRRPLRDHPASNQTATLGDGFPTYPAKGANGVRPQLHVFLRFEEPVVGPILLCAGRFLGYGLCKPLLGGADR